jgi:hypothetical protein
LTQPGFAERRAENYEFRREGFDLSWCLAVEVLVQISTFNRFSDFPESGQSDGGILNRLFFCNCWLTFEYRRIPDGASGD